jgi:ketosteroid isomerase-like protein
VPAETAEAARQPLAVRESSRRHLDERLLVRFPALLRILAGGLSRLPPSSRLRRIGVARAIRISYEAFNRGDLQSAFALFHPDVETIFPVEFASVGFPARTRGLKERVDAQRRWNDEWGEFRNEPEELIDLGDRVVVLGRFVGSGLSSGVGFDREVAYIFHVASGFAIREEVFLDQKAALEAAGLRD